MNALKLSRIATHALVLALLGACASGGGGGGGGGAVPPPPPPPVSPPVFPPLAPPHAPGDFPAPASAEFNANWAVAGTNAQIAWQNGATGAGVLIGVLDDGIHPEHPELVGRISPNSTDIVAGRNALVTNKSHGSELSSLMVGNFNGQQTVGLAFDAHVLAVRTDNGSGSFLDSHLAAAVNYARAQGVDVINLSLGGAGPNSPELIQAITNATAAGIIIVVSAGNSGNSGATQPNNPGLLASDPAVSNGLILVAGGLNPDGSLNTVSNPPGPTANSYLVAPGWQIIVPDFGPAGPVPGFQTCGLGPNGDLCQIQGTSYASPMVTAAIALVMDGFPGMTPAQVVDLLLTTADDVGAPGTDNQFGRGRLNIGRAFQPVGSLLAPMAAGFEVSPTSVMGALGPAFGDGFSHSGAWTVAGFDYYDRTFPLDLSGNWLSAHAGPSVVAQAPPLWRSQALGGVRVQASFAESAAPDTLRTHIAREDFEQNAMRIEADLGHGFTAALAAHGARASYDDNGVVSHLDAVQSDLSLRLTREVAEGVRFSVLNETGRAYSGVSFAPAVERQATAARASFDLSHAGFDLTLGRIEEDQGVLGLVWSSDFGATPGGETRFAGLGLHLDPSPIWRISASAEFGVAEMAQFGWLQSVEPLRTTAFSVQARATPAWLPGAVTFSITQPLRVEHGVLSFMAPVANKYGRQSLTFEQRQFSPTPSGRELRLGVGYSYWRGETLSAFGEAFYVMEPGHMARAEPDLILRFGLRVAH